MAKTKRINNINFKRYPYRGIFTEVARELSPDEEGVNSQKVSVFRKYNMGEPTITKRVNEIIKEREEIYKKASNHKPIYNKTL